MEYYFDTIYNYIEEYLFCNEYNRDEGFYINFSDDEIIIAYTLEEMGYDLNDDGTLYRDSDERPVLCPPNEHCHLMEDITKIDECGKRVPNVEYIDQLILKHLSV